MAGRRVNRGTIEKLPTTPLTVGARKLDKLEALSLGLRQEMVSCEDGSVSTGAGLGTDWIIVTWKGDTYAISGIDLLKVVVAHADPESLKRFEGATVEGGADFSASSF